MEKTVLTFFDKIKVVFELKEKNESYYWKIQYDENELKKHNISKEELEDEITKILTTP